MRKLMRSLLISSLFISSSWAKPVTIDLFMSSNCPHCHQAVVFLEGLKTPPIELNKYIINEDKKALALFYDRIKNQLPLNFTVPTLFFCGTKWVGFDTPEHRGKEIASALQYCYENTNNGALAPKAQQVLENLSKMDAKR